MEACRDDREASPLTIGFCDFPRAVGLHDATTSSSIWPSLERFVSM
jgi:hypothetical protein